MGQGAESSGPTSKHHHSHTSIPAPGRARHMYAPSRCTTPPRPLRRARLWAAVAGCEQTRRHMEAGVHVHTRAACHRMSESVLESGVASF